jgi:CheY-like chemotaxis protein
MNPMENTKPKFSFILVDDDPINNMLCSSIIEHILPGAEINKFTEPTKGFDFIKTNFATIPVKRSVLYLDINMPGMNGWEFMEAFDKLDENIKEKVDVYILSSSIDPRDIAKADSNPNIVGYFTKPLRKESILLTQKYLLERDTN